MTAYNLPTLDSPVGAFKFKLYCDTAGLTVPTIQTILDVGELTEQIDLDIGLSQFANLTLSIRDDYSTYSEGFWCKVLSVGWQLRICLEESGSDTFYFFGIPQEEQVEWTEHYVGSSRIRTARITLVSAEVTMFDTATSDWIAEVYTNRRQAVLTDPSTIYEAVNIEEFFACLLKASGLNSTYQAIDVDILYNIEDIHYLEGVNSWNVDQLYLPVTVQYGATVYKTDYIDSTHANFLGTFYPKASGLFSAMLRNFGLVAHATYNTATERHQILLLQRARAYGAQLDFSSSEVQSTISKSFALLGDAAKATYLKSDAAFVWFSRKFLGETAHSTAAVPDYVDFDLDVQVPFSDVAAALAPDKDGSALHGGAAITTAVLINDAEYYNYNTDSYEAATNGVLEAVAGYEFYRFTNKFSRIVRRYAPMSANNGGAETHTILNVGRPTPINDGIAAATYFANRVTKIPANDEVEFEWIL